MIISIFIDQNAQICQMKSLLTLKLYMHTHNKFDINIKDITVSHVGYIIRVNIQSTVSTMRWVSCSALVAYIIETNKEHLVSIFRCHTLKRV